jgi:glucose/mannose-6-phosphate isomerase
VLPIFLTTRRSNNPGVKRLRFTISVLKDAGYNIVEVPIYGEDALRKILYGIYLGDYISIYLAVLRGIDPQAVGLIDRIRVRKK